MSEFPLHVLILEDNPADAELMSFRLKKDGFHLDWQRVENEADYRAALKESPDLILSDWSLPHFSGLRALEIMHEQGPETPFIIVSGSIGEETAVVAMRLGAYDYLLKDRLERLGQAVRNALEQKQLHNERKNAVAALRLQSTALNAAANAIVITTREGVIEWVNPAFTLLTGYTFAEALGKNLRQLVKSGMQTKTEYKQLWDTILAGQVWQGEMTNRRKDGQLYMEEQTITPLRDPDGQITQFVSIKQDISMRKRTEESLKRRSREISTLFEASQQFNRTLDLQSLYTTFYHFISRIMVCECLYISSYDAKEQLIHCVFAFQDGISLNAAEFPAIPLEPEGHGTQSRVIRSGESMLVGDSKTLMNSAKTSYYVDNEGKILEPEAVPEDAVVTRSAIIVPILLQESVVGVVQIFSFKLNTYSPDDLQMAEALTAQFTVAVNNADLFQQAQVEITERKRVEKALVQSSEELKVAYDATLQGWSNALELRERETAGHSQRVVRLTLDLAFALGINPEEFIHIQRGALLHDIGKMGIPDNILLKPGPLTADELVIMRQHPVHAYNLLSKIPYLSPALDIPYRHHEHWDGSGYPHGLKGDEIPLTARMFAVVDVWDALLSDRPYRRAWTEEAVIKYLKEQVNTLFDARVVEAFLRIAPHQPTG